MTTIETEDRTPNGMADRIINIVELFRQNSQRRAVKAGERIDAEQRLWKLYDLAAASVREHADEFWPK